MTTLQHADAVPIFFDGSGNVFGLDLSSRSDPPAVYWFDGEREFDRPRYAAGSSLGAFLLLLGEEDQAYLDGRPAGWQLAIDPDLDKCPRAPPPWRGGGTTAASSPSGCWAATNPVTNSSSAET